MRLNEKPHKLVRLHILTQNVKIFRNGSSHVLLSVQFLSNVKHLTLI